MPIFVEVNFVKRPIAQKASRRKYEDPTQWLIDAGIAYYSFNTAAFELPFEATENRKLYKLYMVDTGLLGSILLKGIQFLVLSRYNVSKKDDVLYLPLYMTIFI